MDHKESTTLRLAVLAGFLAVALLAYLGVLYDTQVTDYDYYTEQSVRSIARTERVEGSRGIITDRNGRVMVSNRSTYNLTFDPTLLRSGTDPNQAVLRLLELCRDQGVAWVDSLPISLTAPFTYTLESAQQKEHFLPYLKSLKGVTTPLGAYLLEHPEVLRTTDENGQPVDPAAMILADEERSDSQKAAALVKALTTDTFSTQLLEDAGISPGTLLELMREKMSVPEAFTLNDARLVLGVQYELALRKLDISRDTYVLAEDIDIPFISLLSDGGFSGAKVTSASVREYETSYAAHILGTVGPLYAEDKDNPLYADYPGNATVGKSGVEAAFEEYLHGKNGRRVVSTNADGKITGEYYSTDPRPGSTVELTIDLPFQQAVEDALAETVSNMNKKDGNLTRGAGAAVVKVGSGEVLALASYPTYDLATFRQAEVNAALSADPGKPFQNRATSSAYPPGSTFKPMMAVAALEEGAVGLNEKIKDTGYWLYPDFIEGTKRWGWWCWNRSGHGKLNVSQAITNSCNTFFYEMGYRLGIDKIDEYALAFGLGEKTGIEIGESAGTLASREGREASGGVWYGGDTVQAAIGQSDNLFTPLQLANYIATLVSGGQHYETHLLKAVKSYDNSEVLAVGTSQPTHTVEMKDSTLEAVKKGMLGYTQPGGQVHTYFQDCVVTAGAKTGTAQLGGKLTNNGVFVCFAPYEKPEIAVAIAIEKGGSGAALASTAVKILNAYFAPSEIGTAIIGEDQLMQ